MTPAESLRVIDHLADYNAFTSVDRQASGEKGVVAVKDCLDAIGLPTTAGSIILDDVPRARDSPVVAAIRQAGWAIIGKANMHEFAFGVTSVNPHFGSVRNPADPSRVAGGSSGGSAAAVAFGMCDWAVGTDSGGSIRIPSALCGVVGIKPTTGTIDATTGIIPLSKSLDTVGPIAPDVDTAARALAAMTGRPATCERHPDPRIAVPAGWISGLDEPTADAWRAISRPYPEIKFPSREAASRICNTLLYAEASGYHARWYTERPGDYGRDVLASIEQGRRIRAFQYLSALEERPGISAEFESALTGWDALLLPASACVAPRVDDCGNLELLYRFTQPFNVSGHPVVTIPAPVSNGALPVGVQVIGHLGRDSELITVAAALEDLWSGGSNHPN